MNRRDFLKSALLAAVAASVPMELAKQLVEKAEVNDDYAALKRGDFVDLTFYGTGMTFISKKLDQNLPIKLTIDGMAIDGELQKVGGILSQRTYDDNQYHQIVSGLPLGIHTLRAEISRDIIRGYDISGPVSLERHIL
jgi:hypothetical protein